MELFEMQERAAELEQQISALPAGSITKKTVNGKEYFYHRWTENKKRREKYISADEEATSPNKSRRYFYLYNQHPHR